MLNRMWPAAIAVILLSTGLSWAAPASQADTDARRAVKLVRNGDRWMFSNGIVELVFDTARVGVTELRFEGGENVLAADGMYLDCNVPEGYYGFTRNAHPMAERARVCARTGDDVDVAVRGRFYDRQTGSAVLR